MTAWLSPAGDGGYEFLKNRVLVFLRIMIRHFRQKEGAFSRRSGLFFCFTGTEMIRHIFPDSL
jgi:hypothetical protein